MARTGRKRAMHQERKSHALRLARDGCLRKEIAARLGVAPVTLQREAARDPEFGAQLDRALSLGKLRKQGGLDTRVLMTLFLHQLRAALEDPAA